MCCSIVFESSSTKPVNGKDRQENRRAELTHRHACTTSSVYVHVHGCLQASILEESKGCMMHVHHKKKREEEEEEKKVKSHSFVVLYYLSWLPFKLRCVALRCKMVILQKHCSVRRYTLYANTESTAILICIFLPSLGVLFLLFSFFPLSLLSKILK